MAADARHRSSRRGPSQRTRKFNVSHLKLVRSVEAVEICADLISALQRGVSQLTVKHSGDCCNREPWSETVQRLTKAVAERRHTSTVYVRLGSAS